MNVQSNQTQANYIGRFAPSPTGPLHLGSLIAAVASYVDAKSKNGIWVLRMEDLDPPREPPGTADLILDQLYALGIQWDGEVLYQSSRINAYRETLKQLSKEELCYPCGCTRLQIKAMGSVYNGSCRNHTVSLPEKFAIRVKTFNDLIGFNDKIQGHQQQNVRKEVGDFIVLRKDNLFAYQLAVVVDDSYQKITDVVRGYDLIDSTPRQIHLQKVLGFKTPKYAHIPIILNDKGHKLSKQNFATPIEPKDGNNLIFQSLKYLGQKPPPPMNRASTDEQLQWAISNWDIHAIPKLANIRENPKRM